MKLLLPILVFYLIYYAHLLRWTRGVTLRCYYYFNIIMCSCHRTSSFVFGRVYTIYLLMSAPLTEINNYCAMRAVSINIMGAAKKWVLSPFAWFMPPKTVLPVVFKKKKKKQTSSVNQISTSRVSEIIVLK